MKRRLLLLAGLGACLALHAIVKNTEKPLIGEWDFRPQKVWEVDGASGEPFARPGELRASREAMLYFHDFERKLSYAFDCDGKLVGSFARQGSGAGEVDRYLNCFIAGDKVWVGTPGRLLLYSRRGNFVEAFENNLFARFPLLFLSEGEFLFTPLEMGKAPADMVRILSFDLRSQQEKLAAEFPAPGKAQASLPVIVLGLTPQVKMDIDPQAGKIYYGRSDEYTIHVSDLKGSELFSFSLERKRKSVGEDEKRKHLAEGLPKDAVDRILPLLPGELTQFMRIEAAGDLVFVYATESLDRRQGSIPVDIFSGEGKYLYHSHLRFGDKAPLYTHVEKLAVRGNHCYALLEDGSGRSFLAKYRISLPSAK